MSSVFLANSFQHLTKLCGNLLRIFKITWKLILILPLIQSFPLPKAQERKKDVLQVTQLSLELRSPDSKSNQRHKCSVSSSTLNDPNPPVPEICFAFFFILSRLLLNYLNIQVFTVLLPCPYTILTRLSKLQFEKSWMRDRIWRFAHSPFHAEVSKDTKRSLPGGYMFLLETDLLRFHIFCSFLLFASMSVGAFNICWTAAFHPQPLLSLWQY